MNNAHDHDRDRDHAANDNGKHERPGSKQVTPGPAGGALTSLAALQSMLNSVATSTSTGHFGRPLMQFKSRENGAWMFGRSRTVVEDGSLWAFDPRTFMWGYVCFGPNKNGSPIGEVLVSVGQPKPDITKLPDKGFPWTEQRAVNMKCISGIDAGIEVIFKINTQGGIQAIDGLIDTVRDRLNGNQHEGKVAPIATLGKDSYPHKEHGRIWIPVLTIADWMSLDGPAPTPAPAPAPESPSPPEQPRRRRVA